MGKIYRILGKRGRITIPFEIRTAMQISSNDILSFFSNENKIIITKEKICNHCNMKSSVNDFVGDLSVREKQALLNYLVKEYKQGKLR